jgi:hypothetical protein
MQFKAFLTNFVTSFFVQWSPMIKRIIAIKKIFCSQGNATLRDFFKNSGMQFKAFFTNFLRSFLVKWSPVLKVIIAFKTVL